LGDCFLSVDSKNQHNWNLVLIRDAKRKQTVSVK
jgi:hypothetical protein